MPPMEFAHNVMHSFPTKGRTEQGDMFPFLNTKLSYYYKKSTNCQLESQLSQIYTKLLQNKILLTPAYSTVW